ncbi:hypothetical protein [Paenarthrobacter sp. PH39-S1]|uniref:hypothetical protein n=1 Tax=Paenarthrobacter sp. PH39-S1 TaxID=3046204 RepID=UPI0024BAB3C5|nr:hypothetical protein [Paenarthrobacter sp. PH39-S1]MDJ0358199.1 hypothetical protein [Paenarthrobacter sp. PH39-S1]
MQDRRSRSDEAVVWKLDRLGRNTRRMLEPLQRQPCERTEGPAPETCRHRKEYRGQPVPPSTDTSAWTPADTSAASIVPVTWRSEASIRDGHSFEKGRSNGQNTEG